MSRNLLWAALVAAASLLSFGCGSSEPTNAEILKDYKIPPSKNPNVPVIDGANKEFGPKGKPMR